MCSPSRANGSCESPRPCNSSSRFWASGAPSMGGTSLKTDRLSGKLDASKSRQLFRRDTVVLGRRVTDVDSAWLMLRGGRSCDAWDSHRVRPSGPRTSSRRAASWTRSTAAFMTTCAVVRGGSTVLVCAVPVCFELYRFVLSCTGCCRCATCVVPV